jgi:hypothetical protein
VQATVLFLQTPPIWALPVANSLSGATNALLEHPVHFCLNGITRLGWAPSCVFAASRVDSARRKKRGDTFHRVELLCSES